MQQDYYFKHAKWVGAPNRTAESLSVLRGHFSLCSALRVSLCVLGLGFFKCYINGTCINPDTFLPFSSDYEATCDPTDEVLSGHRVYVPQFDVTPFVKQGDNVISVYYGGGWYTSEVRRFGLPKVIYCLSVEREGGTDYFVSDEHCRVGGGFVTLSRFSTHDHLHREQHDYRIEADCLSTTFDDSQWKKAVPTEPLCTDYCSTDCPCDALIEQREVKQIGIRDTGVLYDCGENTTGYPVLEIAAPRGEAVVVQLSEELSPDGDLDDAHIHGQQFVVVSDGTKRLVQPEFNYFGFRYFRVKGAAQPTCVKVVHADVKCTSSFDCDNETLNWIYRTFVHTMLCNMHTGHPSDCPHIERRGYTGDGQLTCHAALSVLDSRAFYEKWLQDIADGQDTLTGHVQYTAPYVRSGGGPGGWGCAIVVVPYQLYRHFGDKQILERYYPNMKRYIHYLESHSEGNLVTSDKPGEWCLGDWCAPSVLYPDKAISTRRQQPMIPAPMVNTYFMVKSLMLMCEIAALIGQPEDVALYRQKAEQCKAAIKAAYFNPYDDNFIMNAQGANAFGIDIGLGNANTYHNMVRYYRAIGCFDTGIFATDILTRLLFENGDAELAVSLLTSGGAQGFERWRQAGATTLCEYWDRERSRSLNHPMFGAVAAYLFDYLLGIQQPKGSAGYASVVIAPQAVDCFSHMRGSIQTPRGSLQVGYVNSADAVSFTVVIPPNTNAALHYAGQQFPLVAGENTITVQKGCIRP